MKELHSAIMQWLTENPEAETVAVEPCFWYDQDRAPGQHGNTAINVTLFRVGHDACTQMRLPIRSTTDEIVQCLHNLLLTAEMHDNALLCSTTNPEEQ